MTGKRFFDFLKMFAFLALLAVASAYLAHLSTEEVSGAVRVLDGDSIVLEGREIRLVGIDAPEYRQVCKSADVSGSYPCGREAAGFLRSLTRSGDVTCSGNEIDKYDRLLAVCHQGSKNLNSEMVLGGWAIAFGDYEREESLARKNNSGLWSGEFDLPSDWRRSEIEKRGQGILGQLQFW